MEKRELKSLFILTDHVNKSQSTNDVFPTAMHMAIAIRAKGKLIPNLKLLNAELKKKLKNLIKL